MCSSDLEDGLPVLSSLTNRDVEADRSHTAGYVITDRSFIGPATILYNCQPSTASRAVRYLIYPAILLIMFLAGKLI